MGLAPHFFRHLDQPIMGPHTRGGDRTFLVVADGVFCYWYEKSTAVRTDCTLWKIVPACAGKQPLPGGLDTAASRAILLSDAKRIGWTAFLTPTSN